MNTIAQLATRRSQLIERLNEEKLDAFLVTALPNVRYLSGFTGSSAHLLVTRESAVLFSDPRYQSQAPQESDCKVKIARGPLLKQVVKYAKKKKLTKLGFEQNRIAFDGFAYLKEQLGKIRLNGIAGLIESLRMLKSPEEIEAIRRSVELNSKAFKQAIGAFKQTMSERDLSAEIEYRMKKLGADGTAFDTIVASGTRSALPHAHPTSDPIKAGQLLLVDMGAVVAGYASDMTRTLGVGKLGSRAKQIYKAVHTSQQAAIDVIRPGVTSHEVDKAARKTLQGFGMDKLFIHSTGHGLGLEIHEGPRLGRKEPTRLEQGMTITVEPGVYDEQVGGVRIEDTVVVTATGCEVLTPTAKELMML